MPDPSRIAHSLHLTAPALGAIVLLRLWRSSLLRCYPLFAISLSVSLLRTLLLLGRNPYTDRYFEIWAATEPFLWASYILVAFEIHSRVLRSYRGIAVLGRRTMAIVLVLGAVAALLAGLPEMNRQNILFPLLQGVLVAEKAVILNLLFFLLFLWGFLAWYPIPLRKNLKRYSLGYTIFFLSVAAGLFFRNVGGPQFTDWYNVGILAIQSICLMAWAVLLSPQGEAEGSALRPARAGEDAGKLLDELRKLNEMLLQSKKSLA